MSNPHKQQQTPEYWPRACRTLARRDPIMADLIRRFDGSLYSDSSAFQVLCRTVVGQQISVRAADSIWQRVAAKLPTLTPTTMLAKRRDVLRRCGLSASKAQYLKNLATFFQEEVPTPDYWRQDIDVIRQRLTSIKGIGIWSYEMFAIFFLHHPDIFPIGDLGLRNAIGRLYHNGASPTPQQTLTQGEQWAPWRTVATWYLWRSVDNDPVLY